MYSGTVKNKIDVIRLQIPFRKNWDYKQGYTYKIHILDFKIKNIIMHFTKLHEKPPRSEHAVPIQGIQGIFTHILNAVYLYISDSASAVSCRANVTARVRGF